MQSQRQEWIVRATKMVNGKIGAERKAQIQSAPIEALKEIAQGFADIIRDEDYVASASQQRSAASGALPHVVFGRNEPALHHYHNTYHPGGREWAKRVRIVP